MAEGKPEKMKAIVVDGDGADPFSMKVDSDVETPKIKEGQVLVRVGATAINRADTLQRKGRYPPPAGESSIMGLEFAGKVIELGPGVKKSKIGDRVCGLLGGGGYAEYVAVDERLLFPVPDSISDSIAAGFPEAFITAFQTIFWIGGVSWKDPKQNENLSILIHAGGSGVGTAAIQMCKLAGVGLIITTAGRADKLELTKSLGAHHAINYKEEDFSARVQEITGGKGVSLVIDCVGQSYWSKNLDSIALEGKMVMLGFLSGASLSDCNLAPILRKRLTITGSTLRTRSLDYKAELIEDLWGFLKEAWSTGQVRVIVHKELEFAEIGEAHRMMEAGENLGKIIVRVSSNL
eukprot:CAMPEP_0201488162 /NCGR_PEP_ID=MMETSP0151_2-20130828/17340_1 /ASSEMBLY_ACC=CAM_ASM_000257 /TAXON_ID=200890 /ORGANISM="Paramoeba atlantica, Strain 621/1 / CCAP 1560/9" /LENGTH=348 /DNA_ID=CAMNT_0047873397 /DNA_START=47 /DNA_END=1093 /DNA_ORIENTATION=-